MSSSTSTFLRPARVLALAALALVLSQCEDAGEASHVCSDLRRLGCQFQHEGHPFAGEEMAAFWGQCPKLHFPLAPHLDWNIRLVAWEEVFPPGEASRVRELFQQVEREMREEQHSDKIHLRVEAVPADYTPAKGDWLIVPVPPREPEPGFKLQALPAQVLDRKGLPAVLGPFAGEYHHLLSALPAGTDWTPTLVRNLVHEILLAPRYQKDEIRLSAEEPVRENEVLLWLTGEADFSYRVPGSLMQLDCENAFPSRKLRVALDGPAVSEDELAESVIALSPFLTSDGLCMSGEPGGIVQLETWLRSIGIRNPELGRSILARAPSRPLASAENLVRLGFGQPAPETLPGGPSPESFRIPSPPFTGFARVPTLRAWQSTWGLEGDEAYALLPVAFPASQLENARRAVRAVAQGLRPAR